MVADPLHAVAILPTGENIEADLGPVVDAFGELNGFVLLMIGGNDAVDVILLAFGSEVGMELDHEVFGSDGFGSVDLDLVVALGVRGRGAEKSEACDAERERKPGERQAKVRHSETPS